MPERGPSRPCIHASLPGQMPNTTTSSTSLEHLQRMPIPYSSLQNFTRRGISLNSLLETPVSIWPYSYVVQEYQCVNHLYGADLAFLTTIVVRSCTRSAIPPQGKAILARSFPRANLIVLPSFQCGIVHGSLKPSNILINDDGQALI